MRRPTAPATLRAAHAGAVVLVALLAAGPARAQFAGVPAPPPRPPRPAPVVAARPGSDSASRLQRERDSLATVQRLDIQAWVDSAAPALARRPAADSVRRPTTPARRPDGVSLGAPGHGAVVTFASVADRRRPLYLRPWPCQATYRSIPSRSV